MTKKTTDDKHKTYRFSLVEDESHKQIWVRRFSVPMLVVTALLVLLVGAALAFSLIAYTPLRTLVPGYPDAQSKSLAVQNAIRIDSLQSLISRWDLYAENLRRAVEGEQPVGIDSIIKLHGEVLSRRGDAEVLAGRDSLLRATVQEEEQFDLSGSERQLPIEGLHFFTPVKGVVSQGFDAVMHPYIDISAPSGSVVKSVLGGTVIFALWNDETAYTIGVQHGGDIISVYKHNQKLLCKTGDKVSAGSSIALTGSSGNPDSGDHLHFELWYRGEAVDPTLYIVF